MSDLKTNLVQSADAAARVGVLFVAVAMFAAMWESDSPPSKTDDHWLAQRAGASNPAAVLEDAQLEPAEQSEARAGRASMFKPASTQITTIQAYPMPVGITPGTYCVIDTLGMTDTLRVTAEMVSGHDSHQDSDQYIIENGDRKIYFIRIHGKATIAGAHHGAIRY